MRQTPLRSNDICFCGTGKLYKHCCQKLTRLPKNASLELKRRYWRKTVGDAMNMVSQFAEETDAFEEFLDEAIDEYSCGEESELISTVSLSDGPLQENFYNWFLFNFYVDLPEQISEQSGEDEEGGEDEFLAAPIAILAMAANNVRRGTDRDRALGQILKNPFTFYKVVSVRPGESILLRDIFLNTEITVLDLTASRSVEPGLILYTKILSFDDVSILIGAGQIPLLPTNLDPILKMKEAFQEALDPNEPGLTHDHISAAEDQIRKWYLALATHAASPSPPILHNTDGDLMEPRKLSYAHKISDVMNVVNRLDAKIRTLKESPPFEILDQNSHKKPISVMIPWVVAGKAKSGMDSVLIARFIVHPDRLEVSVNSQKRSERAKQVIEQLFGNEVTFLGEEAEPIDPNQFGGSTSPDGKVLPPEVSAALASHIKKLEDSWMDTPIPALRGMTPREASKDAEGRDLLEALLNEYSLRSRSAAVAGGFGYDVPELRVRLGLTALS